MINSIKLLSKTAAALAVAAAFVLPARAQSGRTPLPSRPRMGEVLRNEMEREMIRREMEEGGKRAAPARDEQRLTFAQASEDFRRIQLINIELVRAASGRAALDFKLVAKSAGEIRKRAQRLKTNLALPGAEKTDKLPKPSAAGHAADDLKPTLLALGKLIAGFAHNPVFKEAKVLDAQHSVKARRDLEEIIETSAWVTKHSERLDKSVRKSR